MDNASKDGIDHVDDLEQVDEFDRITRNPAVMRITVGTVVGLVGYGYSIERILEAYPYLEREDVLQAVRYAASLASSQMIGLAAA
jgi:uncharacterized protein (DUF433 family)